MNINVNNNQFLQNIDRVTKSDNTTPFQAQDGKISSAELAAYIAKEYGSALSAGFSQITDTAIANFVNDAQNADVSDAVKEQLISAAQQLEGKVVDLTANEVAPTPETQQQPQQQGQDTATVNNRIQSHNIEPKSVNFPNQSNANPQIPENIAEKLAKVAAKIPSMSNEALASLAENMASKISALEARIDGSANRVESQNMRDLLELFNGVQSQIQEALNAAQ